MVVISEEEASAQQAAKKGDDFFSEDQWGTPPQRLTPVPGRSQSVSPAPMLAAQVDNSAPVTSAPVTSAPVTSAAVPTSTSNEDVSSETTNVKKLLSSTGAAPARTGGKRGGKLGVKKVAISFDEMEAKAKEEAARREELQKQGLLDLEKEKKDKEQAMMYGEDIPVVFF